MGDKIFMTDVLDEKDVTYLNGVPMVSMAGLLKLSATALYHQLDDEPRRKAAMVVDAILDAAKAKGWRKHDLFRSAFAKRYPPTRTAKEMAEEVMGLFSTEELWRLFAKREGV